jgi:hypothetical protein
MDMERVVGSDHKAIGVARRGHETVKAAPNVDCITMIVEIVAQ